MSHVAGVPGTFAPERVLAINYLGPRLLTRLLSPHLRDGGALAFVSSIAAQRCAWPDEALRALTIEPTWEATFAALAARATSGSEAYDLSKRLLGFALHDLVAEFAPRGVRVNLVSPGPVETPILAVFARRWEPTGSTRPRASRAVTLGRKRSREPSSFCCVRMNRGGSPESILVVDGGLSALRRAAARKAPST